MQQQERALSALQAEVAKLQKQQLQSDATLQAALDLFLQHLETSPQIWASQDDKKLEDQLQQAAAKQQDADKIRQEFASRIAKVEQQWQQAAVDEKVPQQPLRACIQSLEATVQTLKSADDAQEQLQQASTDNASQPIEGLRQGECERAKESAGKQERASGERGRERGSQIRRNREVIHTHVRMYLCTYVRTDVHR